MREKNTKIKHIKCNVCKNEVPKSVAKSFEGTDYMFYFCGPSCYDHWLKKSDKDKKELA